MRRTIFKGVLGLTALALVLSACGGSSGGGGTSASSILRIGSDSTIDSLNPFVGFNQLSYATYQVTYPYLVQYDPQNLTFKPYFATKWETSADGKDWTFTLVPDAKWSDGEPLNSDDIAWNFNTLVKYKSNGTGNWAGTIAHLKSAEAVDPTTVVLHYAQPVANVLSQLQQIPMVPPQFWSQYISGGKANFKSVKMVPPLVSGGPYQVTSFEKDSIAKLAVNKTFWGTKPNPAGIGIQMYKNDDAMVTALKSGDIDLIESLPATAVDPVKKDGFDVQSHTSTFFYDFIFNSNPKKPNNRELLDPRVRQAFAESFDLQNMVDTVWLGNATLGNSIVPPSTDTSEIKWSDPSLQAAPYDPADANKILDDLGYKKGSDGIRVADGHRMSYEVIMPDLTGGDRMFQLIQGWLKAIGVEVKQKKLDDSAAFSAIGAPGYKYLNFDLAMWDWIMLPDPDFALSVVLCNEYGNWSDTGYCNPKYDALYAKQGTQTDQNARLKTVYKMQQMIAQDRPYIILAYQDWAFAYDSSKWTGFENTIQGPVNALSIDGLVNPTPVS